MSVHDTKIQDFTNVLKQFYAKVKALIPTKVSQLTNDKGYKTTDTTYTNFVKSGSGAKAGLVPAPPTTAGTSKYLREDGTWQATPAAVTPVNNLLATTAGSPLDAVQGKVLNDKIDGVNSSLKGFEPILDDTGKITGYKTEIGGADTVFPFSGGNKKVTISGTVGYYIASKSTWASAATVNLTFNIDGSGNISNISGYTFQTGNIQPNYISVTYGANASTNAKFVVNSISIS